MPDESIQDPMEGSEMDLEDEVVDQGEPYWCSKTAKDVIQELQRHENVFFETIERRGFGPIWRSTYAQWHGLDPQNWVSWDTQQVSFEGEDGELLRFRINEFRSYVKQIISMAVGSRPSFQTQAANTDYASLSQVEADDTIVNAIYEQKLGEQKERRTVTEGVLYGLSFSWVNWDPGAGRSVDVQLPLPPEMGGGPSPATRRAKSGDLFLKTLSPWDLIRESTIENVEDHLWSTAIDRPSKWDLAAQYPRFAKEIKQLSTADHDMTEPLSVIGALSDQSTDRVKVRHWYHKKSEALPAGRYIIYAGSLPLYDGPMPYDELPFVEFCPSQYLGTAFGYADVWDLLPVNQLIDQLISDISTNLSTFGRQLITVGENTDVDIDALANGLRVLTLGQGDEPPQALQLAAIPAASQWFLGYLEARLQRLSGLNAVSRGDAATAVKSGQHAALLHSIAVEAQGAMQLAVDSLRERSANLALRMVGDFSEHPLAVAIAGVDERPYLLDVPTERIQGISRVKVRTANPMLRTQAGRLELAQMLLGMPGAITDPAQVLEIIVSGQIKPLYQAPRAQLLRIRWENEQLGKGTGLEERPDATLPPNPDGSPGTNTITPDVPVLSTDNPKQHIEEHLSVLATPLALRTPEIRQAVLAHVAWHIREWRDMDPALAMLLGFPPPPPSGDQQPGSFTESADQAAQPPKPPAPGESPKAPEAMVPTNGKAPKNQDMGVKIPKASETPISGAITGQ